MKLGVVYAWNYGKIDFLYWDVLEFFVRTVFKKPFKKEQDVPGASGNAHKHIRRRTLMLWMV
jgi:hypothetical protein